MRRSTIRLPRLVPSAVVRVAAVALAALLTTALGGPAAVRAAGASPGRPAPARPSPAATPHPTVIALARLSGPAFDIALLRELIPLHEEAVEIAYAATLNADHPELLQWNQRLIDRKNGQVRQFLAWLQEAGATPGRRAVNVVSPPVKQMRSLKGATLERVYLPMMAARLEHTAALAELAAARAARAELRTLGQSAAAIERREAAMLRGWLKDWYGR